MKAVHLTTILNDEQGYCVPLGNGTRNIFPNKKDAKAFLAECNRFLTHKLVELNEIFSRAFLEYRQLWFTLANAKQGKRTNYSADERVIRESLASVELIFDRVASGAGYGFADYTTFINARKICLFLSEILKALVSLNKRRNNTVSYYSLENLIDRVHTTNQEINAFSKDFLEAKEKPL